MEKPATPLPSCAAQSPMISGGFGLLAGKSWGLRLELAALGMLLYCAVFSVGVFGQASNAPAAIFFAIIFTVSVIFSMNFILDPVKGGLE